MYIESPKKYIFVPMKGLRNILFIIATLLPCLVSSQEDSIIIIDTASVEIFNNKTNEYEIWGYINIINNTDEEYITWITKNSVATEQMIRKLLTIFFIINRITILAFLISCVKILYLKEDGVRLSIIRY